MKLSERALIMPDLERRSNFQGWAWTKAHPKSGERECKLALIFTLKIIQSLENYTVVWNSNKYLFYISLNLSLFYALNVDFENKRQIEHHTLFIDRERERKTLPKLSASVAQHFPLSTDFERKQLFWAQ